MVRMRCPRCSTEVQVEPGMAPVCPTCGFGAPQAPAPPRPRPSAPEPPRRPAAQVLTPSAPPPPIDPLAAPVEYPEPAPPAVVVEPAPRRGWVMPTVWGLLVLDIIVESIWFSMVFSPAAWRTDGGSEPFTAAILVFAAIDIGARCTIAILLAKDSKALGSARLKMAQVPATGLERTSPTGWGVTGGIFTPAIVLLYAIWRGRIRALGAQAATAPQFATKKELKAAHKKPGVFSEPDFKAMRKRSTSQTVAFILAIVVLRILSVLGR